MNSILIIGDLAYETTITDNLVISHIGGSGYYALIGSKVSDNNNAILISSVGLDFDFDDLYNLGKTDINVVPNKKTASFTTEFISGTEERKFTAEFGALESPNYSAVKKYLKSQVIFLTGSDPVRQLAWIKEIKRNNYSGIIACDVFELFCKQSKKETLDVIELSDIIFMNEVEQQILNFNPFNYKKISIIKRGAKGAILTDSNGTQIMATFLITKSVVNTNGAGDILAASFLSKMSLGLSQALQYAVNTATKSVYFDNKRKMI